VHVFDDGHRGRFGVGHKYLASGSGFGAAGFAVFFCTGAFVVVAKSSISRRFSFDSGLPVPAFIATTDRSPGSTELHVTDQHGQFAGDLAELMG
jgi:hypothetical protein